MGYPKKPVVLVVDDTIANIRILDDLLRDEYTVRVATNGTTALRLALSEPRPDIVLLDIMMPEMDGYEVCRRLKSDPLTSNIAVVFITAMGNEEHEAKGLDLGAVDFIAKPFQPRLVRARVSNHVALKKYNDELNSLVKERTKELYLSRSVTVECLASVVETRDNETGAHVRRTQHGVSEPRPDIVLLDIMMPEMDGYEVCRRLKSDPLTSNIAVVFITAMGNEEHEAKGLDLGAVDFIAKPFQPRLVRARVSNHVALKKYNDELNSLVKERTKELYLSRSVTVECLASVVETRDNETGAHVRRTQHGVEILAKRLRLMRPDIWDDDDDTIELFRVCAPLHDVGKVGIPDSILRKPGKLTEAEFNEMKKHTTLGYQTLSWAEKRMGGHNDFLRLGAVIAYTHHERWDGKGYPRSLKGEEIPRVGRLMALADVYDALISKRVYKPAFDHETARKIIVEGRGTQFDPLVVEAFLFEEDAFRSLIVTYPDDENPLLVSND